jgi:hypothetical protein
MGSGTIEGSCGFISGFNACLPLRLILVICATVVLITIILLMGTASIIQLLSQAFSSDANFTHEAGESVYQLHFH